MPATAGRVRMPANNRVHSSAALQTHGIWQSAIGYDPYAPNKDEPKASSSHHNDNAPEPGGENAYMSFQGLLELAKITNTNDNESRGCCKKCGRVGHLTFQCKNFISVKEEIKDKGLDSVLGGGVVRLEKSHKVRGGKGVEESSEEESESSDSGYDSEIERAIAKRCVKSGSSKVMDGRKKGRESGGEDSGSGERKKRKRSESRRYRKAKDSDSESEVEDGRRKRRKVKSRKRDKSVDDEERRRRRRKRRTSRRRSKEKKSYKRSDKKRYKHHQDD